MSTGDFDEGYNYSAELREFARELGFKHSNFRKIELENLIREPLDDWYSAQKLPCDAAQSRRDT